MSEVKVGDYVRDNDPRNNITRAGWVAGFEGHSAIIRMRIGARTVRVSLSRIFADGKPRRSGWSVVEGCQ